MLPGYGGSGNRSGAPVLDGVGGTGGAGSSRKGFPLSGCAVPSADEDGRSLANDMPEPETGPFDVAGASPAAGANPAAVSRGVL